MFGQTIALMTRSLREDTRLLRASLVRLGVLLIIGWFLLIVHADAARTGAPGLFYFSAITYLNLFVMVLAGMSFFATTISEEKEERTLGLLKMAGVSPLAILMGKSTSRLLVAVLVLTLEVPFILLAVTLGGVLLHQVAAAYCTLLAFLLLLGNVALFCSVICRSSRGASTVMTILSAGFLLAPPMVLELVKDLKFRGIVDTSAASMAAVVQAAESVNDISPFSQIGKIIVTGFSDPVVGHHVLCHLLAAVLFFLLSWAAFGICTQNDEPPSRRRAGWAGRRNRTGRVWQRALVWKDFTFFAGGWFMQLLKFSVFGLFILLLHVLLWLSWPMDYGTAAQIRQFGTIAFYVGLCSSFIQAALCSGRFLREEAQMQTLSAICLLPQSFRSVAYLKLLGCGLGLVPALSWAAVGMLLNPDGTILEYMPSHRDSAAYWMWFVMFVVFLHVAAYLSLYVKWGGVPLAFVVVFVGGHLIILTVLLMAEAMQARPNENAVFGFFSVIYLIPIPFLHLAVARRLQELAGR